MSGNDYQIKYDASDNLWIKETWINASKGWGIGESEPYETFTDHTGDLYRSLQQEYGRCVGKMYVDRKDGETVQVGWVFQGRDKYQDSSETYLRETWITVWSTPPVKVPECWTGGEYAF